ncbi:actin filament-associated protein 1-like 2 isoform X2 [Protopterus annectens]|uniref:actin filament-associated protein 1-like 2 isoform X2 n=1 Tax=Protopterus annectens TaxID=7888 RepID=UPI001CFBEADF|nr:actin filament-associated protein 1-like 2 isoform X2 [Protopterus annectens]
MSSKHAVLEQILKELQDFLKILDQENLSSSATVKKSLLSDLVDSYVKVNGCDEEYIYMNKVIVGERQHPEELSTIDKDYCLMNIATIRPVSYPCDPAILSSTSARTSFLPFPELNVTHVLTNGDLSGYLPAPQKKLPDLPPPKIITDRKQYTLLAQESPEGYYEEAEPYQKTPVDDDAVSSSYESYDEDEIIKGKSATHQWPSTEATIDLMKDARICAFLWRKKWLGQWAKQLCIIKENRLMCYKSSKDHSAQLDICLLGCTVTYKMKQEKKKEHKLKIVPTGADVIVLGLQSKDQAEQWLKVIQEVSGVQQEIISEGLQTSPEILRFNCTKTDLSERCSAASESGSSTDGHPDTPSEAKDVKKKSGPGLKLSNLMNLGRKKQLPLESNEKPLETSGYLNVLVNSQWKARWCHIKDGHLYFFVDKSKNKSANTPLALDGCEVIPEPRPEHLYSFRILHGKDELAILEAKSSEDMGHWLGLLLAESGSKTDPEEFEYDYVDADKISCIVTAAKNSFFLMQRKCTEPNTYTENLPDTKTKMEDLYDDVDISDSGDVKANEEHIGMAHEDAEETVKKDSVYLDLTPLQSFLHSSKKRASVSPLSSPTLTRDSEQKEVLIQKTEPEEPMASKAGIKIQAHQQKISFPQSDSAAKVTSFTATNAMTITPATTYTSKIANASAEKQKLNSTGTIETKLGKNRTEAEAKRYLEEKERLEREKEEIRSVLANLKKQKKDLKEAASVCTDKTTLVALEAQIKEIDEDCKQKESYRVDLELKLVEVKENLRKAESGPVTLGTAVDATHFETACPTVKVSSPVSSLEPSPVNSATALKSRPVSVMLAGKGTVLQKAKEWEKKATT